MAERTQSRSGKQVGGRHAGSAAGEPGRTEVPGIGRAAGKVDLRARDESGQTSEQRVMSAIEAGTLDDGFTIQDVVDRVPNMTTDNARRVMRRMLDLAKVKAERTGTNGPYVFHKA